MRREQVSVAMGARRGFNPRTRAGCDYEHGVAYGSEALVSIHAPARGATSASAQARRTGAFQSTHPRGVRPHGSDVGAGRAEVSIHAPARGATSRPGGSSRPSGRFNPRTRAGCDLGVIRLMRSCRLFQSTHPRGVRPGRRRRCPPGRAVSIHAPARGATSHAQLRRIAADPVSIHAPARGAT